MSVWTGFNLILLKRLLVDHKLRKLDIGGLTLAYGFTFLSDRNQFVITSGGVSKKLPVVYGVIHDTSMTHCCLLCIVLVTIISDGILLAL